MEARRTFISGLIIFILVLSLSLLTYYVLNKTENPFSNSSSLFGAKAPADHVKEDQIEIQEDKVIIYVRGASISRYAASGSMKPTLDENSNGIRIVPLSENDINVGDIVSYKKGDVLIVHRVVEKGIDEEGVYFVTKGDNNSLRDEKVRFKDIKYLTIGVIF